MLREEDIFQKKSGRNEQKIFRVSLGFISMKRWKILFFLFFLFLKGEKVMAEERILLPPPKKEGRISLEETIQKRRSRRAFEDLPLSLEQVSQLLWAAQGITGEEGFFRSSPSAGATYPLTLWVVVGKRGVKGLKEGVYRYLPHPHALVFWLKNDLREGLARAALGQKFIAEAPLTLVISADYNRTTRRYGKRGIRYVHIEVGHVGENIYLQAEALGLGTVAVGAFWDEKVKSLLKLPREEDPLYLMPVGYPRRPLR